MNVNQLRERLAAEAEAAPAGAPDARLRIGERAARQARRRRTLVGATAGAVVIVVAVAVANLSTAKDTRVRTASGPERSVALPSPTRQAAACLANGQLKAAVLEGVTAGRHWIVGIQSDALGAGGPVDMMVVAFPPDDVTKSCGERFGSGPLSGVAQQGWPNPAFSLGGGGGSRFPSFVDGLTAPDVARVRIEFDNGATATVSTVALPAQYTYRAYLLFPLDYGYPPSAGAEHVDQVVALDDRGQELARVDTAQTRRCPDGQPFDLLNSGDARLAGQIPAPTPTKAVDNLLAAKFPSLANVPRQDDQQIPPGWLVVLDAKRGVFEIHQRGTGWIVDHGSVCPDKSHP